MRTVSCRSATVSDGLLLANPDLMVLVISDQRIGNVTERLLDGLLISDQGLRVLLFGEVQISAKSAAGEDGLADLCAVGPDSELCRIFGRKKTISSERTST